METVNDIIQDMRYAARLYLQGGGEGRAQFEMLDSYADKLDAAYKRDMQAMTDAGEIDMRTAMDEVTRLRDENERLKAADMMECERRYEYGIDYTNKTNGNVCSNHHHFDSLKQAKRYATPLPDEEVRFVRRAVGEWEEV